MGRIDESLLFTGAGMVQFKPLQGSREATAPTIDDVAEVRAHRRY